MMEVDRVLRPGGYWILSGPPINWKTYYQTWKRSKKELQAEQRRIEEIAEQLCWEKKYEKGDIAIFRKKLNDKTCQRSSIPICETRNSDDVWSVDLDPSSLHIYFHFPLITPIHFGITGTGNLHFSLVLPPSCAWNKKLPDIG